MAPILCRHFPKVFQFDGVLDLQHLFPAVFPLKSVVSESLCRDFPLNNIAVLFFLDISHIFSALLFSWFLPFRLFMLCFFLTSVNRIFSRFVVNCLADLLVSFTSPSFCFGSSSGQSSGPKHWIVDGRLRAVSRQTGEWNPSRGPWDPGGTPASHHGQHDRRSKCNLAHLNYCDWYHCPVVDGSLDKMMGLSTPLPEESGLNHPHEAKILRHWPVHGSAELQKINQKVAAEWARSEAVIRFGVADGTLFFSR